MFNPVSNINLDDLWDSLGTAYRDLNSSSKAVVEEFWTAMFKGVAGMYYDLYQNYLAKYFNFTQGYIEQGYQDIELIFTGDDKNVEDVLFSPPSGLSISNTPVTNGEIYSYKVTTVDNNSEETLTGSPITLISGSANLSTDPNVLTWNTVSGATSYNIYGRDINEFLYIGNTTNTTYSDDGTSDPSGNPPTENTAIQGYIYHFNDGYKYMSIPTLSGYNTNQVLTEGVDYQIEDLTKLKLLKSLGVDKDHINYKTTDVSLRKGEKFLNKQSVCLLPTLNSIYFPGFGVDDINEIISAEEYLPFTSGWNNLSYFDKRTSYSKHLSYLMYGLSVVTRREPTVDNIKQGFGLSLGFPFSYKNGTVSSIDENSGYKYITITTSGANETIVYELPTETYPSVSSGEVMDQFELLTSGIFVDDYITDFETVSGISLRYGEIKEFDVFTQTYSGDKHSFNVLENIIDDVTDVKQSDTYTVNFNELKD